MPPFWKRIIVTVLVHPNQFGVIGPGNKCIVPITCYVICTPTWMPKNRTSIGPSERVTDEINEAVMVHTKTLNFDMTGKYETRCRHDYHQSGGVVGSLIPIPWTNKGASWSDRRNTMNRVGSTIVSSIAKWMSIKNPLPSCWGKIRMESWTQPPPMKLPVMVPVHCAVNCCLCIWYYC